MNTTEEIKNLCTEPFNCEKLDHFKKVAMGSYKSFVKLAHFGDGLDKDLIEFKVLCKYHIESFINDLDYKRKCWEYMKRFRAENSET